MIALGLPRPILLVGGSGYGNVGDEAMLAGLLQLTGRDGVTVVSRRPAVTGLRHDVRAVGVAKAVAELARHRSVVIGGGGLFGRDMGSLGRLLPLFGLVARFLGRDVALVGIGIDGPPNRLVAALARRATRVVVRDEASVGWFLRADVRAELVPDFSTLLEPARRPVATAAIRDAGLDPAKPIVGLCLTEVNPTLGAAVADATIALVDAAPDLQFLAIPMSRHPYVARHDDERFARRLAERRSRIRILPSDDPATVLAVFGRLEAAVCMRYHSLLFADRAGTSIVAIPYAPKCDAWLAEHGLAAIEPTGRALVAALGSSVARVAA